MGGREGGMGGREGGMGGRGNIEEECKRKDDLLSSIW